MDEIAILLIFTTEKSYENKTAPSRFQKITSPRKLLIVLGEVS